MSIAKRLIEKQLAKLSEEWDEIHCERCAGRGWSHTELWLDKSGNRIFVKCEICGGTGKK